MNKDFTCHQANETAGLNICETQCEGCKNLPEVHGMSDKMMPVHSVDRRKTGCPKSVPYTLLDNTWAMYNHSQSLDQLAECGGMGAYEILANMDRMRLSEAWEKWKGISGIDELNKRLAKIAAKPCQAPAVLPANDWIDVNTGGYPGQHIWVILGSLALLQLIATYWCADRVDRATKAAAKGILDSMRLDDSIRHVLNDTLHIPKGPLRFNGCEITRPEGAYKDWDGTLHVVKTSDTSAKYTIKGGSIITETDARTGRWRFSTKIDTSDGPYFPTKKNDSL